MTARILGFHEGLKVLEHVDLIRIVSSTYNLLILKDYMPVLGEINENVTGYFMHSHNEFELLITGE